MCTTWSQNVAETVRSPGASSWARRSSKYWVTPLKRKERREGRTARVGKGGLNWSGDGNGNLIVTCLRFGNETKQAAITPSEIYPVVDEEEIRSVTS